MILRPGSNEHACTLSKFPDSRTRDTDTTQHAYQEASPVPCVVVAAAIAALCPAPKRPGIIRQPRAGPELPNLTTRTSLRPALCFCNGHLTPCESWLCSCTSCPRPLSLSVCLLLSPAGDATGSCWGRHRATALGSSQIRTGKRRSISRVFPRVSPRPTASPQRGAQEPSPGPTQLLPAPIRVAVKVLSHGFPQFWNS